MSLAENIALRLAAVAATNQRRPTAVESGAIEARIHRLHAKGDNAPYIHKMLSLEFPNSETALPQVDTTHDRSIAFEVERRRGLTAPWAAASFDRGTRTRDSCVRGFAA
jgi:hypothetical protein